MAFLFRFFYRHLKGYRSLVLQALLVSFLGVAIDILTALPLKYILAKLQDPKNNPDGIWNGAISFFDQFSPTAPGVVHTALGVILFAAALLVVATLLAALVGYVQFFLVAFIGQNLTARLRKHLFEQIQRLSLDWH